MRADAANRTMEAVARGGPARILAFAVGGSAAAGAAVLVLLVPFGMGTGALLLVVPLIFVSVFAFWVARVTGRGVSSHHLEQAILRYAADHDGEVRVVGLAQTTGRSLRECQVAIDAMVQAGHATVDADEHGTLLYRVPDLVVRPAPLARLASEETARPRVAYDVTMVDDAASSPVEASTAHEEVIVSRIDAPPAKRSR